LSHYFASVFNGWKLLGIPGRDKDATKGNNFMGRQTKRTSPRTRKSKARTVPAKSKVVHLVAAPLTIAAPVIGQPGLSQKH
jgi:hypothetical protein